MLRSSFIADGKFYNIEIAQGRVEVLENGKRLVTHGTFSARSGFDLTDLVSDAPKHELVAIAALTVFCMA